MISTEFKKPCTCHRCTSTSGCTASIAISDRTRTQRALVRRVAAAIETIAPIVTHCEGISDVAYERPAAPQIGNDLSLLRTPDGRRRSSGAKASCTAIGTRSQREWEVSLSRIR